MAPTSLTGRPERLLKRFHPTRQHAVSELPVKQPDHRHTPIEPPGEDYLGSPGEARRLHAWEWDGVPHRDELAAGFEQLPV